MYPGMRAVLERDGQPVAVPVTAYAWKLGLNIEGFEKIGLSKEELPTDWEGFVDLLAELPDLLPDDGSVRVFDEYYTQGQVKEELMGKLFEDYHDYISADGRDPAYNTPEMQRICQKILDLDYEALGLKESDEDMGHGRHGHRRRRPESGPYTLIQTAWAARRATSIPNARPGRCPSCRARPRRSRWTSRSPSSIPSRRTCRWRRSSWR